MAQLHRDPKYNEREVEKEKAREARIARNRAEAAPLVDALGAAGFRVSSLSDLRNRSFDYKAAIPILIEWLAKIESLDVKQDIVRCLSVPIAKPVAARPLLNEYRRSSDESPMGLRWTIGNALAVVADDGVLDDLVELARDRQFGKTREMLVLALGNMTDERVLPVLIELLNDDDVCGYAIMALGKLKRSFTRAHIEPFLKDKRAWIRDEAKRALKGASRCGERPTRR
ncbi:MAG TPA: HEAT repeat domain-containing protein [Polyangiaceae bacterium]